MKRIFTLILICLFINGCKKQSKPNNTKNTVKEDKKYVFDLQGHRGAKGLLPENTLVGFKKALEIGVNTIELDVVITKDKKVLVSHEPWLNSAICLDSLGNKISEENQMKHNIYNYTYDEIKKIDCGSIGNKDFPNQKKVKASKPLLSEVIDLVESYTQNNKVSVGYNIELKSDPKGDDLYHPTPSEFSDLVIKLLKEKSVKNNIVIQSFDTRVLEYINQKHPSYTLAYLVYKGTVKENLDILSFTPKIYSPNHKLLSEKVVANLHKKGMKVIPWTINKKEEIRQLLNWKVDGIITDYPNIAKQLHKRTTTD